MNAMLPWRCPIRTRTWPPSRFTSTRVAASFGRSTSGTIFSLSESVTATVWSFRIFVFDGALWLLERRSETNAVCILWRCRGGKLEAQAAS